MITIEIKNADEVVKAKKGWFVAGLADLLLDLDAEVEKVVAQKVREALAENGVVAVVERTPYR
ncbi:hypothetical protein R5W24_004372 [Gemmata sp. JC717]|uniref:Uncharacterized protein n=1 Tax=Gemmata algarum TaxID=2975278 RepID=A0ABU5F4E2_9BACT|nr:hypothetical protein [Gemmata algarum]MDY3555233.1 hypothetical protein [Gemmata algarum]MDY3562420.1 hypothetical protein [Gemmata algarum]